MIFTLIVTFCIGSTVFGLLTYALVRFRQKSNDDGVEPPQIYGSNQIELAWTIIPILIVLVLFLASIRVIFQIQHKAEPEDAVKVTAIGHQWWWEFRYPQYGVVTANELHVPVSDPGHNRPTFLTLTTADVDHSFWVPRLNGKQDLFAGSVNYMWINPHKAGVYEGQCAQYCGAQHAHMLIRVVAESPADFKKWIANEQKPAVESPTAAQGKYVFDHTACINCHTVKGTVATGTFGPDLTHLMSRKTIGAGVLPNTPGALMGWIIDPQAAKPGCLMPAMKLSSTQVAEITMYLLTLK
jgi:cytochrome c oxidase subunit 2